MKSLVCAAPGSLIVADRPMPRPRGGRRPDQDTPCRALRDGLSHLCRDAALSVLSAPDPPRAGGRSRRSTDRLPLHTRTDRHGQSVRGLRSLHRLPLQPTELLRQHRGARRPYRWRHVRMARYSRGIGRRCAGIVAGSGSDGRVPGDRRACGTARQAHTRCADIGHGGRPDRCRHRAVSPD